MSAKLKAKPTARSRASGAALVAIGIFSSRVAGFVRERIFAHVFGNSDAADVFRAAFRIPNLLQNLFGEGVLSASFIPVYSKLLDEDPKLAARVAGIVGTLLAALTAVLVALGVATTPWLIDLVAPGFAGEKRRATIELVQIFFPGMGLLVMSAFCLGVLNSHRRFLASYLAPVAFNAAMIAALATVDGEDRMRAVRVVAWAAVAGSALQLAVQVPLVVPRLAGARPGLDARLAPVRRVLSTFVPVLVSRGVVQVSAYVESMLASLLPTGAVAALGYAQIVYTLPVSLFGMSIAASELPEMSRDAGDAGSAEALAKRLGDASRRVSFFVVPSAFAFVAAGDEIAALLFQTGRFGRDDAVYVWALLAGSAVGLGAATQARLVSSAFFALGDTKTPLAASIVRVVVGTALGAALALFGPRIVGVAPRWGAVGIALATSVSASVELVALRRALRRKLSLASLGRPLSAPLVLASLAAAGSASAARSVAARLAHHPALAAIVVLGAFVAAFAAAALALGLDEAESLARRVAARARRGR